MRLQRYSSQVAMVYIRSLSILHRCSTACLAVIPFNRSWPVKPSKKTANMKNRAKPGKGAPGKKREDGKRKEEQRK